MILRWWLFVAGLKLFKAQAVHPRLGSFADKAAPECPLTEEGRAGSGLTASGRDKPLQKAAVWAGQLASLGTPRLVGQAMLGPELQRAPRLPLWITSIDLFGLS